MKSNEKVKTATTRPKANTKKGNQSAKRENIKAEIPTEHRDMDSITLDSMQYAETGNLSVNTSHFLTGIAVGALLTFGFRKSGILGGTTLIIASSIITKYAIRYAKTQRNY